MPSGSDADVAWRSLQLNFYDSDKTVNERRLSGNKILQVLSDHLRCSDSFLKQR